MSRVESRSEIKRNRFHTLHDLRVATADATQYRDAGSLKPRHECTVYGDDHTRPCKTSQRSGSRDSVRSACAQSRRLQYVTNDQVLPCTPR